MTLFGNMFERRAAENPSRPLTDTTLLDLVGGGPGAAGTVVTERSAMRMSAVWRCVALNSNVPSALPYHVYRKGTRDKAESRVVEEPHPDLTWLELIRLAYVHKNLWGNAYLQKVRSRAGEIRELWPITPDRVQVTRDRPTAANPSGKLFAVVDDWGQQQVLTSREVLHLPGLGYDGVCGVSPIRAASEAIGLGIAAEEFGARLFGSGSLMSGILQTEQRLDKEAAARLKASWRAKVGGGNRNAHDIAILDSGANFQAVSMPNKDSQFIESRTFQVPEVARFFGTPLFLLFETSKSTSWGTGLEQQALAWVQFDLSPMWIAPTEARLDREILRPLGLYGRWGVQGLLRGDSMARAQFYRTLRDTGAFSANDIRELEDQPPISEGGDVYLQPMNYVPLGTDPATYTNGGNRPGEPPQQAPAAAGDDEGEDDE